MTAQPDDAPRGFVPKAELYKALAEIDRLREELAAFRAAHRHESEDVRIGKLRCALRLSPQESAALLALWDSPKPLTPASRLYLRLGMPADRQVNVVVCKANRKLRQQGGPEYVIAGLTGHGGGLFVTDEGRAWLAERVPEVFAKGAAR